ncbi:Cleavage stimulation factor subunit 3 [Strongyloides ratti]|uniref:Cleavage stimulation factor subunit 3 n=1 Tax=Strongyloides ratti TaxID=34506 RepID=A0A090LAK6_STRRB|nr:Cleavage stimulation factor subunit 3 [Strongyloides ratti]CEF66772.1 Cleavage stimulation factor subunit 3 [Strongyloides ratti]
MYHNTSLRNQGFTNKKHSRSYGGRKENEKHVVWNKYGLTNMSNFFHTTNFSKTRGPLISSKNSFNGRGTFTNNIIRNGQMIHGGKEIWKKYQLQGPQYGGKGKLYGYGSYNAGHRIGNRYIDPQNEIYGPMNGYRKGYDKTLDVRKRKNFSNVDEKGFLVNDIYMDSEFGPGDYKKSRGMNPGDRIKGRSYTELKGLIIAIIHIRNKFFINPNLSNDMYIDQPKWEYYGQMGIKRKLSLGINYRSLEAINFVLASNFYRDRLDKLIRMCIQEAEKNNVDPKYIQSIYHMINERWNKRRSARILDADEKIDFTKYGLAYRLKTSLIERRIKRVSYKDNLLYKIRTLIPVKLNRTFENELVKRAIDYRKKRLENKVKPIQSVAKINSLPLEKRIQNNRWDVVSWKQMMTEIQEKEISDVERNFYDEILQQYPNNSECWKIYIEHEVRCGNVDKAEELFQKCLPVIKNINLYVYYVDFVRTTKTQLPDYREVLAKAYEFAIENVGLDIKALPLYKSYIQFLENVVANGPYAENQKISAIRKVYAKAFQVPMTGIDAFFMEYSNFEKKVNPPMAERFIAERMKDYNKIKKIMQSFQAIHKPLDYERFSVPKRAQLPDEKKQRMFWQRYVNWERKCLLKINDPLERLKRISYAYEQYLLRFGRHPNLCYQVLMFHLDYIEKMDSRGEVIAYSEIENIVESYFKKMITEERKEFKLAQEYYKTLLTNTEYNFDPNLIYISYMQFTRRCLGADKYRLVFRKLRQDPRVGILPYLAAANIEFRCLKNRNVAFNILKYTEDKFGHVLELEKEWFDLSLRQPCKELIKEQFKKYISIYSLSGQEKIEAWEIAFRHIFIHETKENLKKIEEERKESLSHVYKDKKLHELTDRYSYGGILPLTPEQCKLSGYFTTIKPPTKKTRETEHQLQELAIKISPFTTHYKFKGKKKVNGINTRNVVIYNPSSAVAALVKETKKTAIADRMEGLVIPTFQNWAPYKPEEDDYVIPMFDRNRFKIPNSVNKVLMDIGNSVRFIEPVVNCDNLLNTLMMTHFDKNMI